MQIPLVSIWMVTYNHEKYIRQSIESVLMQRVSFPIEIIIGEDFSSDRTREIIKEFEQKYPRIIKPIYHVKNVGAFRNAYEFCLPKLKGKYIACLEGDDYWTDPLKLQKQVDFLEKEESYVMTFHDVLKVQADGKSLGRIINNGGRDLTQGELIVSSKIHTSSVMFRNLDVAYEKLSAIIEVANGDTALYSVLGHYGKGKYLSAIKANGYRIHGNGIWSGANELLRLRNALETYKWIYKNSDLRFKPIVKEKILKKYINISLYYYKVENWRDFFTSGSRVVMLSVKQLNIRLLLYYFKEVLKGANLLRAIPFF